MYLVLFNIELKRSDTEDHISKETSARVRLLMFHRDGVPGLQLHDKLSTNIVRAQAVELGGVGHRDSSNQIALQEPSCCWILEYLRCFLDLFSVVIDVDVVTLPPVGHHLRTEHHTVRSSLASRECSSLDVQRSPVH